MRAVLLVAAGFDIWSTNAYSVISRVFYWPKRTVFGRNVVAVVVEEIWLKRGTAAFARYRARMTVLRAVRVGVRVRVRVGWVDARGPVPALSKQTYSWGP